jgi:hypothetical protein
VAGQPFSADVIVAALDGQNNRKYDYLGQLWFATSDTIDEIPYEAGNPYLFSESDSGVATFPGALFILKRSGPRTITVTNGNIGANSNQIRVTAAAMNTFLLEATSPQVAGQSFYVNVDSAIDLYGNPADGEIIISDSIGGGNSPDGIPPSFNHIIVNGGMGLALQTLTHAVPTMLKGTLLGGSAEANTPLLQVLPGILGRFGMAGYPDYTVAGDTFPQGIDVTVNDIYGNVKVDYDGWVYFESSDSLALLPYTVSSPFHFLSSYAGNHVFDEPFSFRTAGGQYLVFTDGSTSVSSQVIVVSPNVIGDFTITAPESAMAGAPFTVSASEARDIWGNLASGTIVISDTVGGGPSPDGTQPIFNAISVVSGLGSANQTLFNSITTVLRGAIGSLVRTTDSIFVAPGLLGEFTFELSSPQITGVPFNGTALLTAFDRYGNLKSDFNAAQDTVVIFSSTGGEMTNNVLRQQNDFALGTADLVQKGTTYLGGGGPVSFEAQSQSGAAGFSPVVDMRALTCENLRVDQATIARGDTATGVISVNNLAGTNVTITDLIVLDAGGWTSHPVSIPALPHDLGPGENGTFNVSIPIPIDLPFGAHPLKAAVRGAYGPYVVGDTLQSFVDTITVTTAAVPGYVDNTLYPETLSTGAYYTLSLRLNNTGTFGISIMDTSFIAITDGSRVFRANISAPLYLPPSFPDGISVAFDSALVDPSFAAGSYEPVFTYYGIEDGLFRSGQIIISDSMVIERRATLAYVAGSLNIDSLAAGQTIAITVNIENSGDADFIVRHENTRVYFSDSQHEYVSYSDTSAGRRVDVIPPGTTSFNFASALVSPEFSPGRYAPQVVMSGAQNGQDEAIVFDTASDSLRVLSPAAIRIDSTYAVSLNAPFVNTAQQCSLRVLIENQGDEAAESLYIRLTDDGSSSFAESLAIANLGGHRTVSIWFVGSAASTPNANEIFTTAISGGRGAVSGNPAEIFQPIDNTALLIVERPAELALSGISVTDPPEAMDDTISVGQSVTISVTVRNDGQAAVVGPRRLFLNPDVIGWDVDSLTRDYALDQPVYWILTAPDSPHDSAPISVQIVGNPHDANDGSSALGPDSISYHTFTIDTRPYILHSAAITQPAGAMDGTLSTDQIFTVTDTLRANGSYVDKAAGISLPAGFTTNDSLIKYPSGDIVSWALRAPSGSTGDNILVFTWLFDENTGDSIGAMPEIVPVTVVEAAALRIGARIAGPISALDGIVEPGGDIVVEALVQNSGGASVGPGQLLLTVGHPDMIPPDPLRDFTVGTPISWTLSLPPDEVDLPIPIYVIISSVPVEENTEQPANVVIDSAGFSIVVRRLYPKLLFSEISSHSGSVFKGQTVSFFTFEVRNNDIGGNFPVGISGLTFSIESNPSLGASDVIVDATITSDSGSMAISGFDGSLFSFSIADTIYLAPAERIRFTLSLTVKPGTAARDFIVRLPDSPIDASVIENGVATDRLGLITSSGEPASWQSDPTAILEQSFAGSISSYPNPFSPREGGAKIGYYLAANSNLEIRIFTLFGELVWKKAIAGSEPLGAAGLHTGQTALVWDGKNDVGNEIRSGAYICVIRNLTSGEEEKFKIAVVK